MKAESLKCCALERAAPLPPDTLLQGGAPRKRLCHLLLAGTTLAAANGVSVPPASAGMFAVEIERTQERSATGQEVGCRVEIGEETHSNPMMHWMPVVIRGVPDIRVVCPYAERGSAAPRPVDSGEEASTSTRHGSGQVSPALSGGHVLEFEPGGRAFRAHHQELRLPQR